MQPQHPQPSPRPGAALTRRHLLHIGILGAAGVLALPGCRSPGKANPSPSQRLAFNTANLVAQFSEYRYELKHWGDQHQLTMARTDATAWRAICREIAATGFRAVEIWEAHAAPEKLDRAQAAIWKSILEEHGLRAIGYAGSLRRETLQMCRWLGIPQVNGGLGRATPEQGTALCREFGVRFNLENHPEKNAAEILAKIGGGNEWLGVCVDTGWLGTQGTPAPETIRRCGKLVRHVHVKDVKAAGAHETCLLGTGTVDVAGALQALRELGYPGWYAWEDEPEDRNPFDSAVQNRRWLEQRLADS